MRSSFVGSRASAAGSSVACLVRRRAARHRLRRRTDTNDPSERGGPPAGGRAGERSRRRQPRPYDRRRRVGRGEVRQRRPRRIPSRCRARRVGRVDVAHHGGRSHRRRRSVFDVCSAIERRAVLLGIQWRRRTRRRHHRDAQRAGEGGGVSNVVQAPSPPSPRAHSRRRARSRAGAVTSTAISEEGRQTPLQSNSNCRRRALQHRQHSRRRRALLRLARGRSALLLGI